MKNTTNILTAIIFFVAAFQMSASAQWVQLGSDINGEAAGDQSGVSVSLSADGSRMAIGAAFNDGNGADAGHVRIYAWNGSSWVQLGSDINGEAAADNSGGSVSLSADGSRVAIGARGNDGNGSNAGHVRIYAWNGSSWAQLGSDIDGEAASDDSGFSVSLSDDGIRVAIGARLNDGNGSNSGHVRIYAWNGSSWAQLGSDINGEAAGDFSGSSVSLSADGSRVAIGAPANAGNGSNSGHVRIYSWNGSSWAQLGSDINGEAANDQSGISASLSDDGSRVAIGATGNDGNGINSGHARIYAWNGSSWAQLGSDIDGEAAGNNLGRSVSLSAGGSRVAIGAPLNAGNGGASGHVRIYDWNGSSWAQFGSDIDGEAANDQSGGSISLSGDGIRVAIGAPANAGNGSSSGHARVYRQCPAAGTPCNDGLFCTQNDVEDGSCNCAGTPAVIDDGIACTADVCDEANDQITHTPNNALCDDNNPGTTDVCNPSTGCENTTPPPIPTLSEWGLIIFSLLLLCTGAVAVWNAKFGRGYAKA